MALQVLTVVTAAAIRREEGEMYPLPPSIPIRTSVTTTTKTSVIQHKYDPVRGRCNHPPSLPHRSNNYSFDLLTLGISCIPRRLLLGLWVLRWACTRPEFPRPRCCQPKLATSYSNYTRPVNGQYTSISSHFGDRDISLTISK